MATGQYQLFQGLSGKGARYVATLGEPWIVLPGRVCGLSADLASQTLCIMMSL